MWTVIIKAHFLLFGFIFGQKLMTMEMKETGNKQIMYVTLSDTQQAKILGQIKPSIYI